MLACLYGYLLRMQKKDDRTGASIKSNPIQSKSTHGRRIQTTKLQDLSVFFSTKSPARTGQKPKAEHRKTDKTKDKDNKI